MFIFTLTFTHTRLVKTIVGWVFLLLWVLMVIKLGYAYILIKSYFFKNLESPLLPDIF